MWRHGVLLLVAVVAGCAEEKPAAVAGMDVHAPVAVVEWALPTLRAGTHSPGLSATHDGRLLLSWVNSQRGRRHVMQFSSYDTTQQRWRGAPVTVVVGNSLAQVQGESPRMLASGDGALWAQWLQRAGPVEVDVMFSRSRDGGANWSEPQMPYQQRASSEHMATVLWPQGGRGIGLAWFAGHTPGEVSLRTSRVDAGGAPAPEQALDLDVSVCARPAVAVTSHGPLLAYRGNGEGDARDHVSLIRRDGEGWTPPVQVYREDGADGDCPIISGPALGAHAEDVVLAWFSHAAPKAIQMAHSGDAGGHFSAPVEVYRGADAGAPLALVVDAQQVWVLWEKMLDKAVFSLWLSRYSTDLQHEYERREVVNTASGYMHGADLGAPQLALAQGTGYLVWVEKGAAGSRLRGVKLVPSR